MSQSNLTDVFSGGVPGTSEFRVKSDGTLVAPSISLTAGLLTGTVAVTGTLTNPSVNKLSLPTVANASTTAVHAAVTDNGSDQTVTTGITSPAIPRNVTATVGGTALNITATQVIVTGTDYNDAVLTETLSAFTLATAGTVTGTKAFKTVTSILVPANGAGVTTAVGTGSKLGIPAKLATNTVLLASLNGTKEGTAPTVTTNTTVLASNGATLNSTLNGTDVVLYFLV